MSLESDAQSDLDVNVDDADNVVGGRKAKKASSSVKPIGIQTVSLSAPAPAPAPSADETPAALPIGEGECAPIHYAEEM